MKVLSLATMLWCDVKASCHRSFMRFIHRHGYHKMQVSYPEGDMMYWCHWCGLRVVLKREFLFGTKILVDPKMPENQILLTNLRVPR